MRGELLVPRNGGEGGEVSGFFLGGGGGRVGFLGVGVLEGWVDRSGGEMLCRGKGCARTNIFHAVLNRTHQPLEMLPQHRQASGVQHQPPTVPAGRRAGTARGGSRRARMAAAPRRGRMGVGGGLRGRESDLLVLPEDVDFGGGEAELRVRDGRGQRGVHWFLNPGEGA